MAQRGATSWVREFAAGAVALAAILLAVWEGWENRTHNRLSVKPKLDAQRNFDMQDQTFELLVVSSGLGPAVVNDTWLYLDGDVIYRGSVADELPWRKMYGTFGREFSVSDAYYGPGHYMTPGDSYRFLHVELRPDAPRDDDFRDTANRIDVVVCYCSVYGDRCQIEHVGLNEVPLPHC